MILGPTEKHPLTGQPHDYGHRAAGFEQGGKVQGLGRRVGAKQHTRADDLAHPGRRRGCQLHPNKLSSLSVAGQMEKNIYEFLTDGNLPPGIAQFFSLQDMP